MSIKSIFKKIFVKKIKEPVMIPVLVGNLLANKTAIIFGASGGIGESILDSFINNGCKVIAVGTKIDKLKLLEKKYSNDVCKTYLCDTSQIDDLRKCIDNCSTMFDKIDIMVYSSGLHCNDEFGDISEDSWDRIINVNLKGMYFACQFFSNYLVKNNLTGHILTIGSASCTKPGWTPYEISKAGVSSLTVGFAEKLVKHGIIVNSIAPGPVATKMLKVDGKDLTWEGNPTGRMCSPKEIANLALLMVSSLGDMMVGSTVFISGGSGTVCFNK